MHIYFVLCGSVYCFILTVLLTWFIGVEKPARICVECQHANPSLCSFKKHVSFHCPSTALFKESVSLKAAICIKYLSCLTDSETHVLRPKIGMKGMTLFPNSVPGGA